MEDNAIMLNHVVEFYKSLFRAEPISGVSLEDNFWGEDDKINTQERESLEMPFSEEEIKKAIFESYADGAPGQMVFHLYSTIIFGI